MKIVQRKKRILRRERERGASVSSVRSMAKFVKRKREKREWERKREQNF